MPLPKVGTRVRTKDSLKHHAGKEGRIITVHIEGITKPYIEYGVGFNSPHHIDAWFLPTELILIEDDLSFGF